MPVPSKRERRIVTSWRETLMRHVDGLASLSADAIVAALKRKDPVVAMLIFRLLYHRSTAWRKRLEFPDDPMQARKEMEQAFTRGDLSTDELAVLIRARDLQLKIAEHEQLKERLTGLEQKLDLLLQGGRDGTLK